MTNSSTGTLSIGGTISMTGSSTPLFITGTGNTAINGLISGISSMTKNGNGTLTLGTTDLLSGSTTVSAGTLKLGADNALPVGTSLNMSGTAVLDLAGYYQQLSNFAPGTSNSVVSSVAGGVLVLPSTGSALQTRLGGAAGDGFGGS